MLERPSDSSRGVRQCAGARPCRRPKEWAFVRRPRRGVCTDALHLHVPPRVEEGGGRQQRGDTACRPASCRKAVKRCPPAAKWRRLCLQRERDLSGL
jgi:hypothetical protein